MVHDFSVSSSSEQDRSRAVLKVTWIGLLLNLLLSLVKFFAGTVGRSQAVVADAVHSLSDCTTDIVILIGVRYWSKPPDSDHPYGHHRIETVITIIIAVMLALVAAGLAYNALTTMQQRHLGHPGYVALAAALLSIVCKETLYRYTKNIARKIGSMALLANAWHHRSDSLSSVPVALAVAAATLLPEWGILDHIGAVMVSLFILRAAWKIGWPAIMQLVDVSAPPDVRNQIRDIVLKTVGVKEVHAIRTRYKGTGLQVDLHVLVDGSMTVLEGHEISRKVKHHLFAEGPGVVDVVIHLEPLET